MSPAGRLAQHALGGVTAMGASHHQSCSVVASFLRHRSRISVTASAAYTYSSIRPASQARTSTFPLANVFSLCRSHPQRFAASSITTTVRGSSVCDDCSRPLSAPSLRHAFTSSTSSCCTTVVELRDSRRLDLGSQMPLIQISTRSFASSSSSPSSSSSSSSSSSLSASSDTTTANPTASTTTRMTQYATTEITADAAQHKAGLQDPEVPPWQNPLHHYHAERCQKIFPEDFDSIEEFEKAKVAVPPMDDGPAPAYLQKIAHEIVHLTVLEMNELVNKIGDHYGFHDGMLSPDSEEGSDAGGGDEDDGEGDGKASEAVVEKTLFDVKLVAFDDKSKIKVIKEVRALAGLGLKEAKDVVEGAPRVILKGQKQEQANEIKAKLEAVGATIEIV